MKMTRAKVQVEPNQQHISSWDNFYISWCRELSFPTLFHLTFTLFSIPNYRTRPHNITTYSNCFVTCSWNFMLSTSQKGNFLVFLYSPLISKKKTHFQRRPGSSLAAWWSACCWYWAALWSCFGIGDGDSCRTRPATDMWRSREGLAAQRPTTLRLCLGGPKVESANGSPNRTHHDQI